MRIDQREPDQMRPVKITTDYLLTAEGSVLIEVGNTRVLCAASIEETVPGFLRGTGKGWVTAEYSMLPRATATRTAREVSKGRASGRTMEIQRLIGRSLRSVVDLDALGERSVILDCDVLQADGGTRTRRHHRSLHRPVGRAAATGEVRRAEEVAGARFCGRHQRRHRRRRADARSVLSGRLAGRGRHERGDDRLGPLRRVAGDRGEDGVRRRATGRAAGAGAQGHRGTGRDPEGIRDA